ncbi:hypothetical protein LT493_44940 [Streptomyces tricolor]|nr:hypothetical protein [Streptomyces tricolor]
MSGHDDFPDPAPRAAGPRHGAVSHRPGGVRVRHLPRCGWRRACGVKGADRVRRSGRAVHARHVGAHPWPARRSARSPTASPRRPPAHRL